MKRIREVLKQVDKPDGLYSNYLNPRSGSWGSSKFVYTKYSTLICNYCILCILSLNFNQVQLVHAWFLEIFYLGSLYACARVCVYV